MILDSHPHRDGDALHPNQADPNPRASDDELAEFHTVITLALRLVRMVNALCRARQLPLEVRHDRAQALVQPGAAEFRRHCSRELYRDDQGQILGQLRVSTLRSLAAAIGKFVEGFERLAVVGSMQLGKTLLIDSLMLFLPAIVYVLSNGQRRLCPVSAVPARRELLTQSREELAGLRRLYSDIVFRNTVTGMETTPQEFLTGLSTFDLGDADAVWTDLVQMRSLAMTIPRAIEAIERAGAEPLLFADETQFGSATGGLLDRICEGRKLPMIAVSATPTEHTSVGTEHRWEFIPMWVDRTYSGPTCFNGVSLPLMRGCRPQLPKCDEYVSFLRRSGLHRPELNAGAYSCLNVFRSKVWNGCEDLLKAHDKFRNEFARQVVSIADMLCDGSAHRQAMFFRLFPANRFCDDLVERMQRDARQAGIELVRFYNPHSGHQTVRQLLRSILRDGKRAIVLATAKSRMGDSFPAACGVFLDLTVEGSTNESILQGTFGRSCGHNKQSLVLLQPRLLHNLTTFLKSGCRMVDPVTGQRVNKRPPSWRTRLASGFATTKRHFHLYFSEDDPSELVQQMRRAAQDWLERHAVIDGAARRLLNFEASGEFVETVLPSSTIAQLPSQLPEELRHYRFLNWGEQDVFDPGRVMATPDDVAGNAGTVGLRWCRHLDHWLRELRSPAANHARGRVQVQLIVAASEASCPQCGQDIKRRIDVLKFDGSGASQLCDCCMAHARVKPVGITLRLAGPFQPMRDTELTLDSMFAQHNLAFSVSS